MCGFFVNHFRQISAKHIMAENSSLVSNKSHALGLDRHNNMATSEDFSSYFVLEVYSNVCVIIFIFYIYLQKNSHMMYSLRFYILFKILKFLYQRILRFFFLKERERWKEKEKKRERFKYHSHCLYAEVNRNGSDNLVLDIPL